MAQCHIESKTEKENASDCQDWTGRAAYARAQRASAYRSPGVSILQRAQPRADADRQQRRGPREGGEGVQGPYDTDHRHRGAWWVPPQGHPECLSHAEADQSDIPQFMGRPARRRGGEKDRTEAAHHRSAWDGNLPRDAGNPEPG